MEWIKFEKRGMFVQLVAVQGGRRLSSDLAFDAEIDSQVAELRRQLDKAAADAKQALKEKVRLFGKDCAQGS